MTLPLVGAECMGAKETIQFPVVIQEKSKICVSRIIKPSGHPDGFVSIKTEGRIDYGKKRRPGG